MTSINPALASSLTPDMLATTESVTATINPTTIIKTEDLSTSPLAQTPPPSSSTTQAQSPPSSTDGKPAKKRKSWGQVLPEPKTNLPPRKRAKTEDEKEQRRIERVKRNRLAAHNSRERKRQEVEYLQAEKDQLADDLRRAREQMARMAAELQAFRQRHPGEVSESASFDSSISTASPESYDSLLQSDTICPRQASFPSPPLTTDDFPTPRDSSCQPETPAFSDTASIETDPTRYPAAILCDLQCQGSDSTSTDRARQLAFQLSMTFLAMINLHLSSMTRLVKNFSTSISSTSSTPRKTSSARPSWRRILSQQATMAFLTHLAQSSSICRQTQAQRFPLATRLALQRRISAKSVLARSGGPSGRPAPDAGEKKRKLRRRRQRLQQEIKRSCAVLQSITRNGYGLQNYHDRGIRSTAS